MTSIVSFYRRTALAAGGVFLVSGVLAGAQSFEQVNLVTDNEAIHSATIQDPNLLNAWGVSYSPTSPFWVSDNANATATLYKVNPVTDMPTTQGLVVTIPGDGTPTGQAFNPMAGAGAFNKDNFLFVSGDGTISGWRGALGTAAETLTIGSANNVYKGTTFGTVADNAYLYSANFRAGTIDVLRISGATERKQKDSGDDGC